MDNLLCEEALWLSSPKTPEPLQNFRRNIHHQDTTVMMMTPAMDEATVQEALVLDLKKESCFSHYGDKFLDFIVSKKLTNSRFQAVQWLMETRTRLNLSFETVFAAANVFDRFIYVTSCNEWSNWMVELVTLTSLSIAAKFNEVTTPSLQDLQMEELSHTGLNHLFHHKTVVEMEAIMLKALDWRVNSVTSYSFSQILVSKLGFAGDVMFMNRILDHLLGDLCDVDMLKFPPSVVAASAMWRVLEWTGKHEKLGTLMNLFGQEHKESIENCVDVMKSRLFDDISEQDASAVKSYLSMLHREEMVNMDAVYCGGDLSALFQILRSEGSDDKDNKKRDRDEYQDQVPPAKRMTMVMSI